MTTSPTKAGAAQRILAAVAADPNVDPEFAKAVQPHPPGDFSSAGMVRYYEQARAERLSRRQLILRVPDEPEDYSDEAPIAEPNFADRAAADWWARRVS